MDDGGREHLADAGLSAPPRAHRLERGAHARRAAHSKRLAPISTLIVRVHHLTRTEKSLVAIARALAADAEILVLDEPTASLPADEVARLFTALRRLRARGVGMIYVSHRLDEVFEIADRMVILRDGRVVCERNVRETTPEEVHPADRRPRAVAGASRRPARHEGSARLVFDRVTTDCAGPLDCRMRAGEVVGLVGLRGAGQESIGRALFGLSPVTGGRILLDGRSGRALVAASRPSRSASTWYAPIGWPESIVPGLSIRENLFLNPVRRRPRAHARI